MTELELILRTYYSSEADDWDAARRVERDILANYNYARPLGRRRRALLVPALAAAVIVSVAGIYVALPYHGPAQHLPAGAASNQPSPFGSLTESQFKIARTVARREIARGAISYKVATAMIVRGIVEDSNTGHRCTSGNLLRVVIIGKFTYVTSGLALDHSSGAAVQTVVLNADPMTGKLCLRSSDTRRQRVNPNSTVVLRRAPR